VSEGFLRVVPRKGIYVVKKTKGEIVEILLVRAALEGMAARLATKYVSQADVRRMREIFAPFDPDSVRDHASRYSEANIRFHELVVGLSRCGKLVELAGNLFEHIRWVRFRAGAFQERHGATLLAHREIIDALEQRDPDLAERRMREHIEKLARYIEERVETLP
jgi:DNA-binding GntR family transcriptional regulator